MTTAQMAQLVDNIRRDGKLTSSVLAYRDPDTGELEILSGHHRTQAAITADLPVITLKVITTRLTQDRKKAIQLSHNAIVGQDDPATLASMYADLNLTAKIYSGLDDSIMASMQKISLVGLSVTVKYQEMNLFFLSADADAVKAALPKIERAARKNAAYVAAYEDFDVFFDTMVRAKSKLQSFNSAITFRMLVDLAMERLDEMEAAGADGEEQ